jgi:hypothetical protein
MNAWLPLLGAPAAWLVQLLSLWIVASWMCPLVGPARGIVGVVSAVALAVSLAGVRAGLRAWRQSDEQWRNVTGRTVAHFTAASALLVSTAFSLAIVVAGVSGLLLSCEATR